MSHDSAPENRGEIADTANARTTTVPTTEAMVLQPSVFSSQNSDTAEQDEEDKRSHRRQRGQVEIEGPLEPESTHRQDRPERQGHELSAPRLEAFPDRGVHDPGEQGEEQQEVDRWPPAAGTRSSGREGKSSRPRRGARGHRQRDRRWTLGTGCPGARA